jgi:hypothetical protein
LFLILPPKKIQIDKLTREYKMGINGLTQFLRPIYLKKRVKDLHGSTFGVDAMAWLYRGFYGQKYANNDIVERFLSFYYRMLAQLKKYNIKVGFVLYYTVPFDFFFWVVVLVLVFVEWSSLAFYKDFYGTFPRCFFAKMRSSGLFRFNLLTERPL